MPDPFSEMLLLNDKRPLRLGDGAWIHHLCGKRKCNFYLKLYYLLPVSLPVLNVCVCVCVCLVVVVFDSFVTPCKVACQAPLSMALTRQEHWSGLPFSSSGDIPHLGIKPRSPALQVDSLPVESPGKLS